MMGKHQEKPWEISPHTSSEYGELDCCAYAIFERGVCDFQIATVMGDAPNEKVALKRAHLIATAPELLEELKDIHSKMNCVCRLLPFVGEEALCDTCRLGALINKAEGRS